jgi:hypothetical protein
VSTSAARQAIIRSSSVHTCLDTTLEREIGSIDERIASLRSSREILAGYLSKGMKRPARVRSTL